MKEVEEEWRGRRRSRERKSRSWRIGEEKNAKEEEEDVKEEKEGSGRGKRRKIFNQADEPSADQTAATGGIHVLLLH